MKAVNVRERGAGCQCGATAPSLLKLEAGILLAATRTRAKIKHALGGVKIAAAGAAKRGFAPFDFKTSVVAMVVVKPDAEKNRGNDQAVNEGDDLKSHEGFRKAKRRAKGQRRITRAARRLSSGLRAGNPGKGSLVGKRKARRNCFRRAGGCGTGAFAPGLRIRPWLREQQPRGRRPSWRLFWPFWPSCSRGHRPSRTR